MRWAVAGPFLVGLPDGEVRPEHEHQAVIIAPADPKRRPVQVHDGQGRLVTGVPCSRAEWQEFLDLAPTAGDPS